MLQFISALHHHFVRPLTACVKFIIDLNQKWLKNDEICVIASLIVTNLISIAGSRLINAGGTSEMYFMMVAFIPMAALSVYAHPDSNHFKKSVLNLFFFAASLILLSGQFYLFLFDAYGGNNAVKTFKEGLANILSSKEIGVQIIQSEINAIQKSDVDGLVWIRENTPRDAIIAVDRATFVAGDSTISHYFYYAIFSERHMYVEGTSVISYLAQANESLVSERQQLIRDLYSNKDTAHEKIKTEGIDYIVQTRWITPDFQPSESFTLVHQTDSLNIYKVD